MYEVDIGFTFRNKRLLLANSAIFSMCLRSWCLHCFALKINKRCFVAAVNKLLTKCDEKQLMPLPHRYEICPPALELFVVSIVCYQELPWLYFKPVRGSLQRIFPFSAAI